MSALIFSAIGATVMTLCDAIDSNGYFQFSKKTVAHFIILLGLLATCYLACAFLMQNSLTNNKAKDSSVHHRTIWKTITIRSIIMLVCWLPWLIALYPANFLGDTLISIGWFTRTLDGTPSLSDHNPLATVVLFGSIAVLGKAIGQVGLAFFSFVLLESALCCFAFSFAITRAQYRFGLALWPTRIALAFYACCPMFPIWNTFLSKDVLFSPLFVIWFTLYAEIIHSRGASLTRQTTISFTAITIFACLSKQLGVYILLPSIFALLIWFFMISHNKLGKRLSPENNENLGNEKNKYFKKILVSFFISAVFLLGIMPHFVLPALQVKPTEHYETLSVPLQQTARYVHDYPHDVTPEEHKSIDKLLDYSDLAQRWKWYIADPVKYRIQEPTDAYPNWMKAYIAQGLRHPDSYLQSYVALESGFGKTTELIAQQLDSSFMTDYDGSNIPDAYISKGWAVSSGDIAQRIYNRIVRTPILNIAFKCAIYTLVIPLFFFFIATIVDRSKLSFMLLITIPVLLTEAGLWISPISIQVLGSRYTLPLIYIAPILIGYTLCMKYKSEQK